jgi:phosphate acetyltransferase/phosphate butyryltransferase
VFGQHRGDLNAIELSHALGVPEPRVAILSAVETVTEKIKSTLYTAALCKMADRRQITAGLSTGRLPLATQFRRKRPKPRGSSRRSRAVPDIFVVPDLEADNMLAKQLEYLADAQVAGIVLGARVPVILTSRTDRTLARLASCAIALLLAHHTKRVES